MRLMNNARYHCTTKALEFYSNNRVKVLDQSTYEQDLNPIENI